MTFNDPKRPRIVGRPAFISGGAVLPRLYILPLSSETFEIGVLLRSPNATTYSWHSKEVGETWLLAILKCYFADPESCLESNFDWKASAAAVELLEDL